MRALLVLVLVASSSSVSAQRPAEETSDFWREVRAPGTRRAQTLILHGRRMLYLWDRATGAHEKAALLESAIERFALARQYTPNDPEPLYLLAQSTGLYERPVRGAEPERRVDEAIEMYTALRAMDPEYERYAVGRDLGTLYSRQGNHAQATQEYERALAAALDPRMTSTTHSNMAESYMLSGDLNEAVRHYEVSIDLAPHLPPQAEPSKALALGHWGLASALDRLGEHRAALESARQAMSVYGGSMEVLRSDGVFFDPPSEIHFYEGLGYLAKAETQGDANGRRREARSAEESWRAYLAIAADDDPWRELAQRHLAEARQLQR